MSIITPDEARQILVLTEGKPERLAFVGLAETILALWEGLSKLPCKIQLLYYTCGHADCLPCQARMLLRGNPL